MRTFIPAFLAASRLVRGAIGAQHAS